MTRKAERVAATVQRFREGRLDPHYAAYFHCFNRQLFYEAHDVLENLWLPARRGPEGAFYQGLIQLAGAFVHLQKSRLRPAAALLKLSRANLEPFAPVHAHLEVSLVLELITDWLNRLEAGQFKTNPLAGRNAPRLALINDF